MTKTFALAILLLGACSKTNPYYCEGHPDNNCLIDAAGGPDTPGGSCANMPCVSGVCDTTTNTCVQCTAAEPGACMGTTPVCSADDTCTGCTADTSCTVSNTCLPDGSCADVTGVLYASTTGGGASACTQADMCSLDHAVALLDSAHKIIKLAPGTYGTSGYILTNDATFVGRDATIDKNTGSNGPVFSISGGITLTLDYVTVTGGDDSLVGHGIYCTSSRLVIHGAKIQTNAANAINGTGCDLVLEQSTLYNNAQGGIYLAGTSSMTFDITDNFIIRNGNSNDGIFGAIYIVPTTVSTSRFEFNTIVDNLASSGVTHFAGVTCDIAAVTAANNIVARNLRAGSATAQQTQGACGFLTSKVQDDIAGLDFASADTQPYSYKIGATSTAMDVATTPSTVDVDAEGDHRPQGSEKDIGADEFKP